MVKEEIEHKFNVGIPCYNHVFMPLQDLTSKSYIKGLGDKAINKERELRYESNKLIYDNVDQDVIRSIFSNHNDGMFHYVSLTSNNSDSRTDFGFLDESKLCSLFYPLTDYEFNGAPDDIESQICEKISTHNKLKQLYEIRSKIFNNDFSELEREYFSYLETNKVINNYLSKLCECVLLLAKSNKLIGAQKYLFILSAYVINYGDVIININGSNESLKGFVKTMCEKYPLKNECLLRSGFINRSMEDNQTIIDSIINKTDIQLDHELCESGYRKVTNNHTGKKREEPTEEDLVYISEVLNDRKMFYLGLSPIGEIKPTGAFDKYGAYVYENGIIVADRLYDIRTIGSLSKDAIYKFNSLNFEERSKLSKTTLTSIANSKFYHTDTWKERVKAYIESDTTSEMKDKALELIKKH